MGYREDQERHFRQAGAEGRFRQVERNIALLADALGVPADRVVNELRTVQDWFSGPRAALTGRPYDAEDADLLQWCVDRMGLA
jgi:hypothetical protein